MEVGGDLREKSRPDQLLPHVGAEEDGRLSSPPPVLDGPVDVSSRRPHPTITLYIVILFFLFFFLFL